MGRLIREFNNKYTLKGAHSGLNDTKKRIRYFFEYVEQRMNVTKLEKINQDMLNSFWHWHLKAVKKGDLSVSYVKSLLYAVNKMLKLIHKEELLYKRINQFMKS